MSKGEHAAVALALALCAAFGFWLGDQIVGGTSSPYYAAGLTAAWIYIWVVWQGPA